MNKSEKYSEIILLGQMLQERKIEHEQHDLYDGYQITVPLPEPTKEISVIEHQCSYGSIMNLLEIWADGSIQGYLSAKQTLKNHRAHKSQGISPVTSSEIKEKERNAMQEINEELENDRSVLEWMLGQYVRAKRRKKQLEVRLLEINAERDSPIGGQGYDPLPRSGGNNEGAAGILMKLADIEDRIYEQKAKADKSMVNVATILNFLPEESMEREICELRHIDGHEWGEIAEGIPMSKSQCHRIHKAAMYELLEFNYVKELVTENRESYEYYIEKKEEARYRRENQARKNAGKQNPEKISGKFSPEKSTRKNPEKKIQPLRPGKSGRKF